MNWIKDFITNPFIVTGISSWMLAQITKCILYCAINKKFDLRRLFGAGGMPSSHSATVSSVAIISALHYGVGSFEFAISLILAFIVCHDAMGVRRETGKQAVLIKALTESLKDLTSKKFPEIKLKDFVGHTPLQVAIGILLGIANAIVMFFIFFK